MSASEADWVLPMDLEAIERGLQQTRAKTLSLSDGQVQSGAFKRGPENVEGVHAALFHWNRIRVDGGAPTLLVVCDGIRAACLARIGDQLHYRGCEDSKLKMNLGCSKEGRSWTWSQIGGVRKLELMFGPILDQTDTSVGTVSFMRHPSDPRGPGRIPLISAENARVVCTMQSVYFPGVAISQAPFFVLSLPHCKDPAPESH